MSRLPIPGGDDGKWGVVLNDFLDVAHNSDGSIKVSSLPAPQVADGSITPPKLSQAYVPVTDKGAVNGVATLDGSGKVPVGQLPAPTTPDATSSAKGIVQLTGDLGGTAAAPTVPGLATKATLKGDWSSTTTYAVSDMVRYKAALYSSLAVHSNSTPGISSPGGILLNRTINTGGSLNGDLDSYPPGTPASDWVAVWAPLKPTTAILVNSITLKLIIYGGAGVSDTIQLHPSYGSTTPLATGTATTPASGPAYVFNLNTTVTLSANTIYWIRASRYRTGTTISFMAASDTALIANMSTTGEASIVDDIRFERPSGSGYVTLNATAGGAVSMPIQLNGPAVASQWTKVESAPDVFNLSSSNLVTRSVQGIAPDASGDIKGVVTKVNSLSPDATGAVSFPVVSKLNNMAVGASGNINAVTQVNGVAATDANGGNVTITASPDGHLHPYVIDGRLYPSVFTRDVGTSIQVPDEGDHTIILSNNTTLSIRIPSVNNGGGTMPYGQASRGQAAINGGIPTNPFSLSTNEYNDRDLRHFCTIILQQDEVGGRTVSWTRNPSIGAGSTPPALIDGPITGPTTIPAPSAAANTVSVYRFEWLGTYLGWVYVDSVQGLSLPAIAPPLLVAGNPWVRGINLGDGTYPGSVTTMLADIQKIPVNLLKRMHQYGMTWEVGSAGPGLTERLLGGNGNLVTRSKVSGSVRRLAAWVEASTRSSSVHPVTHEYGHVVDFSFAYTLQPFQGIQDQGKTKYIFNLHDDPQIISMNSSAAGQSWTGRQDYFVINTTAPDGSNANGLNEWMAQMTGTWLYKQGGGAGDTATINAEYAKASPPAIITQFETWATAMLGSYL